MAARTRDVVFRQVLAAAVALALAACGQATLTATPPATATVVAPSPAAVASASPEATVASLASAIGPTPTSAPATDAPPAVTETPGPIDSATYVTGMQEYPVPAGSHPHDVAPAPDGGVWYTAQQSGALGWLDPAT